MQVFSGQNVLIAVGGSIAAYKTLEWIREFRRLGADVRIILSSSAEAFITPMTFQALSGNPVRTACMDVDAEAAMNHIALARWADYFIMAPATANGIAKIAAGMADDLMTTVYLATRAPLFVCPAMNQAMWQHPATVANVATLKQRGVIFVGPDSGEQACGDEGPGRFTTVQAIIAACLLLDVRGMLAGQHVVVTAGATREPLDPVRYITNRSSGLMGYALAYAAHMAGARVTLISGTSSLPAPPNMTLVYVETAEDMFDAVSDAVDAGCIFIGAAAPADYQAQFVNAQKIKKNASSECVLALVETPDILRTVCQRAVCRYTVGFAAETENLLPHARAKRIARQVDMIVANRVGAGIGFDVPDNAVTIITETTERTLPKLHKTQLAGYIIRQVAEQIARAPVF